MRQFESFEKEIIRTVLNVLQQFAMVFETLNISYVYPELEVLKALPDEYESEFRVSFYQKKKFIDIIECHIYRNGKQIAGLDEFKLWLEEAVVDLIKEVEAGHP